jgi:hypothetical protein
MSEQPQPPLKGLFRKDHFGELVDIKDLIEEKNGPLEVHNDVQETHDMPIEDDEFSIYDIVD